MSSPSASTPQSSRSIQAFVGVDVKNKEERNVEGWRKRQWVTERELCCWLCLSRQVQTYWRNLNIGLCARVRVWLNRLQTQITIENLSMKTCLNLATRKKDASCLANTLVCCTCHVCWWVFMWVNNEILIHWENLRMFFFRKMKTAGTISRNPVTE